MYLSKFLTFVTLFILFCNVGNAQVGIGTSNPNPSSILDIHSTDQGVLFPRIDLGNLTTTSPISNPVKGLMVWNTDAANGNLNEGLYIWDETSSWNEFTLENGSSEWSINGNNVSGNSFFGTINQQPINLKINNNNFGKLNPNGGFSIGLNSSANSFTGIGFGTNSNAYGNYSMSIGVNSEADDYSIGLGYSANAYGDYSVVLGKGAKANDNSIAIGRNANAYNLNTIIIGDSNNANLKMGIGTNNPTEKLQINGKIKIVDGNQGVGKVLTSDSNGVATWQTPSGGGTGANTNSSYGEVQLSSDQTFNLLQNTNSVVNGFSSQLSSNDVNLSSNGITPTVSGVYKISYTVAFQKNQKKEADEIEFYLTKNTNAISGTEMRTALYDGVKNSVTNIKILNLDAYQTYSFGISKTHPDKDTSITIFSKQTNLTIEKL